MALREWIYADESGIHDGAAWCVVAGYRGSRHQWRGFDRTWCAVLEKPEYRIKVPFHSKDFFNRKLGNHPEKNPYVGWPDDKASRFLGELLAVIRNTGVRPVAGAVDVAAFQAFSYGERCQLVGYAPLVSTQGKRPPAPYHLALRIMVEDALERTRRDTELHFVIAEQRELQQRALAGYQLTKDLWLPKQPQEVARLKGMTISTPSDAPGLQAADLLGYVWYGYGRLGAGMGPDRSRVLLELTRNRSDLGVANADGMERLFADVSPERRADMRALQEPIKTRSHDQRRPSPA